ncbi:MAG: choline dehydrogenase, partial [Betaproteobacteria bacterium]
MASSTANVRAFDYVIVGAGTAGCVLANRLTADGKTTVLLLEAGPEDRNFWIHLPIGYAKTMWHPVYNWRFYTEPEPHMHGRKVYWPRGRGLGGSSSINGLIFIRGHPADYDSWAAEGNPGWGWNDVLPYFIKSEGNQRAGDFPLHGKDGPLAATDITPQHELAEAFIDGAGSLGIPRTTDFNNATQEGAGYFQLTTKNGWRCSAAVGYLKPVRNRSNLTVETDAPVTQLLLEGKRATGVRYTHDGQSFEARANREVLLTAGAIHSPQLLQLAGIGPAAHLSKLGLPVVHALDGVGMNLQDHLQARLLFRCKKPVTTNDSLNSIFGRAKLGMQWLFQRNGPLSLGVNHAGLFCRAHPSATRPDIQFHFSTLSADMAGGKVHPWSGFTMSICHLQPTSRGTILVKSRDPAEAPAMQANYLDTQFDCETMVAGVKVARAIAASEPMRDYTLDEYKPGSAVATDDDLLEFVRNNGATIFHPVGTCKMGTDDMAVVDPQLRVRGIESLRVIDGSIMPSVVSGNTN